MRKQQEKKIEIKAPFQSYTCKDNICHIRTIRAVGPKTTFTDHRDKLNVLKNKITGQNNREKKAKMFKLIKTSVFLCQLMSKTHLRAARIKFMQVFVKKLHNVKKKH